MIAHRKHRKRRQLASSVSGSLLHRTSCVSATATGVHLVGGPQEKALLWSDGQDLIDRHCESGGSGAHIFQDPSFASEGRRFDEDRCIRGRPLDLESQWQLDAKRGPVLGDRAVGSEFAPGGEELPGHVINASLHAPWDSPVVPELPSLAPTEAIRSPERECLATKLPLAAMGSMGDALTGISSPARSSRSSGAATATSGTPQDRGERWGRLTCDAQRLTSAYPEIRGRSSAGRAPRSQCGGQGFDPPRLH